MGLLGLGLAAATKAGDDSSWEDIHLRQFGTPEMPSSYKGTAPVSGFLELISRPGWALRSALGGDWAAAGKHLVQMAADIPFGGWVDKKLSLMNLAPDEWKYPGSYDITTEKEKYEFTDMLERWGVQGLPVKGSWGRFGIDVVGGVLDPLSFIGSPAGGLARSALKNTTTTMGRSMLKTALVSGKSGKSDLLRQFGTHDQGLDDILIHAMEKSQALDPRAVGILKEEAKWSRLAEKAEKRGGRELGEGYGPLGAGFQTTDPATGLQRMTKGSFFWESRSSPEMQQLTDWLIKEGHVDAPGGITVGIPFTSIESKAAHPIDRVSNYLRENQTLMGSSFRTMELAMGGLSETVGSLWSRAQGMKYSHLIPGAAKGEAQRLKGEVRLLDNFARDDVTVAYTLDKEFQAELAKAGFNRAPTFWDELDPVYRNMLNLMDEAPGIIGEGEATVKALKELLKFEDTASPAFKRTLMPFFVAKAGMTNAQALKKANSVKREALNAIRNGQDYTYKKIAGAADDADMLFKSPFRVVDDYSPASKKQDILSYEREHQISIKQALDNDIFQAGSRPHQQLLALAGRALKADEWYKANELAGEVGRWTLDDAKKIFKKESLEFVETQFPMHFQAKGFSKDLKKTPLSNWPKDLWDDAKALNPEIMQQITDELGRLEYGSAALMLKKARNLALDSVVDSKRGRPVSGLRTLQGGEYKLTIPEVAHKRLLADNRRLAHAESAHYIRKIAEEGVEPDVSAEALSEFFKDMFGEVTFERGVIRKLLAGGAIPLKIMGTQAENLKPYEIVAPGEKSSFGYKVLKEGSVQKVFHWPGVNKFYKPLLTSHPTNPAYHVGNSVGSIFMLASDDRIGWSGVGAVLDMLGGYLGIAKSPHTMKAYSQALHMDPRKSMLGMHKVAAIPGLAINKGGVKYTHQEFVEAARKFLGGGMSMDAADLMADVGSAMGSLAKQKQNPVLRYNPLTSEAWRKAGENMSNYAENHLRLHGFKKLLESGMDADKAGAQVQKLLVDYSVQGPTDQLLRDIFPFIRFRLGSLAWTRAVLTRPRKLWLPATTQRAADFGEEPRDISKPTTSWDKLDVAIPGYTIPTRAGAEVTLGSMGAAASLLPGSTAARGLAGELHPILKYALESTTDRDMWSGKKFASDTRARGIEKWVAKEGMSRWGADRPEIDGVLKKLLHSSPISRQLNTANKIFEIFEKEELGGVVGGLKIAISLKERQKDALQELKHRLKVLLAEKQSTGELYSFEKILSAKPAELTDPSLKLLLQDYQRVLFKLRDQAKREALGRGSR